MKKSCELKHIQMWQKQLFLTVKTLFLNSWFGLVQLVVWLQVLIVWFINGKSHKCESLEKEKYVATSCTFLIQIPTLQHRRFALAGKNAASQSKQLKLQMDSLLSDVFLLLPCVVLFHLAKIRSILHYTHYRVCLLLNVSEETQDIWLFKQMNRSQLPMGPVSRCS